MILEKFWVQNIFGRKYGDEKNSVKKADQYHHDQPNLT